jgi:hypothetical protein
MQRNGVDGLGAREEKTARRPYDRRSVAERNPLSGVPFCSVLYHGRLLRGSARTPMNDSVAAIRVRRCLSFADNLDVASVSAATYRSKKGDAADALVS